MSVKAEGWAPFGAISALIFVVAVGQHFTKAEPGHAVTAKVTSVTNRGARFPRDVVIAHAPQAMEAQATVPYPEELRCEVGDDIEGEQVGVSLTVDPRTCRRPQMSSTSRP